MTLPHRQIRAIKQKQKIGWSRWLQLNHRTIKLINNSEGIYELGNKRKKIIYVGSSNEKRHRLESYVEMDDPRAHPTKVKLRNEAKFFRFADLPIDVARKHEERIKQRTPFNMDSHIHEREKRK